MASEIDTFEHLKYDIVVDATDGTIYYYNANGELHREEGAAVITDTGSHFWYINGSLHREDGPAVIRPSGTRHWFINGAQLSQEEFNDWKEQNGKCV